jgi:hypothetical protein
MLYLVNAVFFGWIASFWSKEGAANILVALLFALLAVMNCIYSAPAVIGLLGLS